MLDRFPPPRLSVMTLAPASKQPSTPSITVEAEPLPSSPRALEMWNEKVFELGLTEHCVQQHKQRKSLLVHVNVLTRGKIKIAEDRHTSNYTPRIPQCPNNACNVRSVPVTVTECIFESSIGRCYSLTR